MFIFKAFFFFFFFNFCFYFYFFMERVLSFLLSGVVECQPTQCREGLEATLVPG